MVTNFKNSIIISATSYANVIPPKARHVERRTFSTVSLLYEETIGWRLNSFWGWIHLCYPQSKHIKRWDENPTQPIIPLHLPNQTHFIILKSSISISPTGDVVNAMPPIILLRCWAKIEKWMVNIWGLKKWTFYSWGLNIRLIPDPMHLLPIYVPSAQFYI